MEKRQIALRLVLRIIAMLLLLAAMLFTWQYTAAPDWVLWVEGLCILMQAGFMAADCIRYQKYKEYATKKPS